MLSRRCSFPVAELVGLEPRCFRAQHPDGFSVGLAGDVDGQVHVDRDGLVVDCGGLEFELANGRDDASVPELAIGLDDLDVFRLAFFVDSERKADLSICWNGVN